MSVHIQTTGARSPRYPRISLPQAIAHTQVLYDGVHRSVVGTDAAYRILGFSGKTGSSATALGAIRQFGLVDGLRGDLRISELALQILEPSDPSERSHAIARAAESPEVYKSVFDNFGGKLPSSDEAIRSFLIRNMSFSKTGANDCIDVLRETGKFAESALKDVLEYTGVAGPVVAETPDQQDSISNKVRFEVVAPAREHTSNKPEYQASEVFRMPLSSSSFAEIRIYGPFDSKSFDRLIAYMNLVRDTLSET